MDLYTKERFLLPRTMLNLAWKNQIIRFLIIGFVNTVFGYSVFATMIYVGAHYIFASLIATVMGILFNFKMYGKFVYSREEVNLIWRFIFVYSIIYLFNLALITAGTYFISNMYVNGAISTLILALLTFFFNKHFVFEANA